MRHGALTTLDGAFEMELPADIQEIAADFCSYAARDYLILVDCYTDWPDVIFMGTNTTTSRLIAALRQAFCRSGVPDVFWSDQLRAIKATLRCFFVHFYMMF